MSLRAAAFTAGRWTTTSLMLRAFLQLAQTMILARLLAPSDFGLMATMAAMYAVISLLVDLGLSSALIHFPDPSPAARSTLYWLNLAAAVLLMLAFVALAWPTAQFYRQPELIPLMMALSLTLPLGALGRQFCVIAEKNLRFASLAIIELAAAACGFIAAVVVALLGGGAYALVAASLATAATGSALAWYRLSEGVRPAFQFDLRAVTSHLGHGFYRLGEAVLNTMHSQADILIGGAIVGAGAMGFYAAPKNLALQLANSVINPAVTRVGLPILARLQADRAALRLVYLQTLRMTASVNFPIYAAFAIWADEVVALLLGAQWQQAGDYLRLFAVWGLIRSTGNPVGSLLYATGRVRQALWWNAAQLLVVPGLLAAGTMLGGTRGLAASMVCVQVLIFYPLFRWLVQPACGIEFRSYVGALHAPLLATGFAAAVALAINAWPWQGDWMRLGCGLPAAAVVYVAISRIVNQEWMDAMRELVQPLFQRGR